MSSEFWRSKCEPSQKRLDQSETTVENVQRGDVLATSSALMQLALENTVDAVVTLRADGRIDFLNQAAQRISGWSQAQAVGQPFESLFRWVCELTGRPIDNLLQRCMRDTDAAGDINPVPDQLLLVAGDGTRRPVDLNTDLLRDEQGNQVGMALVFRDLTEQRRNDLAVREVQSRLNSTLAAGEIGTWEFDLVDNIVHADPNLKQLFGVSDQAACGGELQDYIAAIHPDDRASVVRSIEQAIESGDTYEATYRVQPNGQEIRWVIARGRVERNLAGHAVRLPGVVVDISAQRRAERELRDAEARWRLALESAEMGAWNINPDTNTLTSDERFRVIFSGSTDPLTYEQAFAAIHPDDRQHIRDGVAAATRPEDPQPYAADYRVVHPDGTIRWVFAKGRANFEDRGGRRQLVSFDGTAVDITDRVRVDETLRESETHFRQLADAIPQLAWSAQPDGQIDWFNNRWYEYTGTTLEQMLHGGWQTVHDERTLPQVLDRWQASLDNGVPFNMEFPLRGADGVFRTFLTKVMPLRDARGDIRRWFGTNTDISEQHQMQEELRRVAAELSDSDRRKDEFLATLAHELRNPLSPIKAATHLMQMVEDDPDEFRELSQLIDRHVDQMVRLIDDLLDVSRISRGKIELQTKPCDLRDVVRNAMESTQPLIDQRSHTLHVHTSDRPLMLIGDATRLSQVLVNLLNNAAKYTEPNGQIWLSVTADDQEALIEVRDNGIGIAAADLMSVFEMFHQLHAEKQQGQGGLGIGLSLVHSLIALHGGSIEVESQGLGQGCKFSVRLPLMREPMAQADEAKSIAPKRSPRRSFRVLVVEDTRANRVLMVRLLQRMGHVVEQASDGAEGLEQARAFAPEIIFSDISMPVMNGYEMVHQLRTFDDQSYVVALSGYGQESDRQRAINAGFNSYMVKPVRFTALVELFDELATKA
ncbi:PAS domain S-box protein [Stieleria sp. TO1_6]|uniref:hybrid sensor histidine kinase/response regulator n=1 Tax=Stieleria tagensis TaxID=2956795 RepID=UPI00209AD1B1|nr:PAS domain S-box protein [Stieleria tagensis]MCO8122387.1 PAS domain S-box protein [Stieleria tagensis]